jgi:hypothetical protein
MRESTAWSGMRIATVDIGDHPPVVLTLEVEEGCAWLIAHMGDRSTQNDRLFYRKDSWARREVDPRAEWARITPVDVAGVSVDILFYLSVLPAYGVPSGDEPLEKAVRALSEAVSGCEPVIGAALVMDS